MNNKRIYYSCCTWLAYEICQRYYGAYHYVWCTPYFDPLSRFNHANSVPPTSNPREIYWSLKKEVEAGDLHSAKINENRAGIQTGADLQLNAGVINTFVYEDISLLARMAQPHDFRPLLLVIPCLPIMRLLKPVDILRRASLMSEEYVIERLPRRLFDVIEL